VIAERERDAEKLRWSAEKRKQLQEEIEYVLIFFHNFLIILVFLVYIVYNILSSLKINSYINKICTHLDIR